jgi:hypothetical protein
VGRCEKVLSIHGKKGVRNLPCLTQGHFFRIFFSPTADHVWKVEEKPANYSPEETAMSDCVSASPATFLPSRSRQQTTSSYDNISNLLGKKMLAWTS